MSTQDTTLPPLPEKSPFDLEGMRRLATLISPFAGEAVLQCCDEIARLKALAAIAAQAQQPATVKDSLTTQQAQQAQGVPREWRSALRKLTFMARTSGGTTGPDSGLMTALSQAEALLSRPYLLAAAPQATTAPVATEPGPARADLIAALTFYANGDHFAKADDDAWDTVGGEPQNYWCDEAGTATVEDGTLARLTLSGAMTAAHFEALDGDTPTAPQPVREPLSRDEIDRYKFMTHPFERREFEAFFKLMACDPELASDGTYSGQMGAAQSCWVTWLGARGITKEGA